MIALLWCIMAEIVGRWRTLSIEEEEGVLGVDDMIVEKGKEVMEYCLLGKFFLGDLLTKRR